jgi:ABC-type nitrate/sulfonate/bicarbonate transport system ATPase subunit
VTLALEVIGLHKQFAAGAGSCLATNSVLREVNLELERGEVAAIVGAAGSGRSTLLLCIAGLLTADHGVVRRFGNELREAAARSTIHYLSCEQLWGGRGISPDPTLHLVDLCDFPALQLGRLRRWLVERSRRGDAALVVADSVDLARHLARRILILREGRLQDATRARARVAESRFVDRPFERV